METLNNSSLHVSSGKELSYGKQRDGYGKFDRLLLNVFDKLGEEVQGGRLVTRRRWRPRSSCLADPLPCWAMCIETVILEDGIVKTQERDTCLESGRMLFFGQGHDW